MKFSTRPTGELFTDQHAAGFLKALGIECSNPVKIRLCVLAGDSNPILFLDHNPVNGEAVLETYSIYAPSAGLKLAELFGFTSPGFIQSLEFNWETDTVADLQVTHSLSVVDSEYKPIGFTATKQ